jgi:hypothetical protein
LIGVNQFVALDRQISLVLVLKDVGEHAEKRSFRHTRVLRRELGAHEGVGIVLQKAPHQDLHDLAAEGSSLGGSAVLFGDVHDRNLVWGAILPARATKAKPAPTPAIP